jgi:hypothetical protein
MWWIGLSSGIWCGACGSGTGLLHRSNPAGWFSRNYRFFAAFFFAPFAFFAI